MQGDLARAGIESAPYLDLEESSPPLFVQRGTIRQSIPPGHTSERLVEGFRVPCKGQWQANILIHWIAQGPALQGSSMFILFEINETVDHQGLLINGMTENFFKIFELETNDALNFYVTHNSPHPAEIEYNISFTQIV